MHSTTRRTLAAFLITSFAAPVLAQEMPAMPVSVATPIKRQVVNWVEFPGRFEAAASVEVRAQVAGALKSVNFTDGQEVEKDQLLFTIDPLPFEATLRAAEAAVKGNQTRIDLAAADQARAVELRSTGNLAEATLQARQQTFLEAQANLDASKAQLETAQINLGYTRITAPIDGRIGRKLVTEGNLIAAGTGGTLLTTIVAFDPIDFYFDVDENSFLTYQRIHGADTRQGEQKVFLKTTDEGQFTREGVLDFLDNIIDAGTGTIRVRARLDNDAGTVTPGQFGRVTMPLSAPFEAILVPEDAIVPDQTRHVVMSVNAEGVVVPKPVERGALFGNVRVITSGLNGDEQIIVNGLMRARPGAKVIPQKVEIEAPADLTLPRQSAE